MAEFNASLVAHSYPGRVEYVDTSLGWTSDQAPARCSFLSPLGADEEIYVPRSMPRITLNSTTFTQDAPKIRKLIRENPEFQPAQSSIHEVSLSSNIEKQRVLAEESSIGDLIATGNATLEEHGSAFNAKKEFCHVIVTPVGSDGEALKFLEIQDATKGWRDARGQDDKKIFLNALHIADSDKGLWPGNGERIEQVCSISSPKLHGTFFAARTASVISIFCPTFSRVSLETRGRRSTSRGFWISATISPKLWISIDKNTLGGESFADMAFNPFDRSLIAIIDKSYRWSVWQLHDAEPAVTKPVYQGKFDTTKIKQEDKKYRVGNDGWCMILWCINRRTLLLCRRRAIEIVDVEGNVLASISSELLTRDRTVQITDIKMRLGRPGEVFITTTTHIWYVKLSIAENSGHTEPNPKSFQVLACWRHHRDQSDTSLRMRLIVEPKGVLVILFSRRSGLVTQYQLETTTATSATSLLTLEPTVFELPSSFLPRFRFDPDSRQQLLDFAIAPLSFKNKTTVPIQLLNQDNVALQYLSEKVHFYEVLSLCKDLSLKGSTYYRQSTGIERFGLSTSTLNSHVQPLTWKDTRLSTSAQNNKPKTTDESFIVDDEEDSLSGIDDHDSLAVLGKMHQRGASLLDYELFTLTNRMVYNKILAFGSRKGSDLMQMISESLKDLRNLPQDVSSHWHPLISLVKPQFDVRDIDAVSEELHKFTLSIPKSMFDEPSRLRLSVLASKPCLGLDGVGRGTDIKITSLYSHMVEHWISQLPLHIPGRTRLAKERVIRLVACWVYLSAFAVRLQQREAYDAEETDIADEDTPAGRLQAYTTIERPPPPPKQALSTILAHWTIGADPEEYNYATRASEIAEFPDIVGSAMSLDDRRRQERRREKKEQRKRETETFKRRRLDARETQSQATPAHPGFMSSQPQEAARVAEASQATTQSQTTQQQQQQQQASVSTQVEPGRFGGRPKLPIRKQGRKKGF